MRRIITMEGHLLDTGLMNDLLDRVTEGGGTFTVLRFDAGRTREERSSADVEVAAPDEATLNAILETLIGMGARVPEAESKNARLVPVTQEGVAPEDFYSTTIYRTEVRLADRWTSVSDQRMDVVIVADAEAGTARCGLIRDLKIGDTIVCGVDGIRTFPPERSTERTTDEFAFMASSVSSERRVELAVEEIARDLRRIRDTGGKTVVVPGPVVVHTGGAPYLAALIREGFVHALLGGNAIATHDMELALFGTSLGVHMERGNPVHEGHKHHLKTINLVRGYGSIRAAVEAGAISGGVMFECVRRPVPYVLAGSIRDDGPLPDTLMDLVAAQAAYQEALRGAELVLMLSTMLHAIGVGNMTPAGVKLVCVDINPAVVTKLADRGSIESVGIVTDVGLFLRLLAERLELV
ncbi:MAG: TIGR00300 family protein [Capsulimonadales bacterium]|nr:TIGR00300 family protein [Capsulimonadales bacterium]